MKIIEEYYQGTRFMGYCNVEGEGECGWKGRRMVLVKPNEVKVTKSGLKYSPLRPGEYMVLPMRFQGG